MLELTREGILNRKEWEDCNILLPQYDMIQMKENTSKQPIWLHFGAGNIFRGFIAGLQQRLLNDGLQECGIIATDTFDFDLIDKIYKPHDNLVLSVGLKADGNNIMEVTGSIAEALPADMRKEDTKKRLVEIMTNPSLQLVSFTITEKGYSLCDLSGALLPIVKKDIEMGPDYATHAMSIVTMLLYQRYSKNSSPLALCSMDNCSHNGDKLQASINQIAKAWVDAGFMEPGFMQYLNGDSIAFPWSMIDKITPRPSKEIEDQLDALGINRMKPVVTNRNTYIAPFVNAEIVQYLVIEDTFPNGRPPLEKAGVYMTNRETVDKTERMKVTTCLNPLHTAMAVYGCLLGYDHIAKEMQDSDIYKLVEGIGYKEGLPVVVDPGIISPRDFIHEVLCERLPNPYIPDMPQRIATDTSLKIPIRFGETLKAYYHSKTHSVDELKYIPLAIAGWFRYLLGVDDCGNEMSVSDDPMLFKLKESLKDIVYNDPDSYLGQLRGLLSNKSIFAINLCETTLARTIEEMFVSMLNGNGSVRETLKKYLKD